MGVVQERPSVLHAAAMAFAISDHNEAAEACPYPTHVVVQKGVGKSTAAAGNSASFRFGPHYFENLTVSDQRGGSKCIGVRGISRFPVRISLKARLGTLRMLGFLACDSVLVCSFQLTAIQIL